MRGLLKRLVLLLLVAAVAGAVVVASTRETQAPNQQAGGGGGGRRGGGGAPGGAGGQPPQPVLVGDVKVSDLPVVLEGVGTVRALNTVTVRAQVEGRIMRFAFKEGDQVKKGDLLVEIDPTTFKAALDQVVAKRQLTETQLANAKRDLERYGKTSPGVIAQKTIDTQLAQVAQFEAQLRADDAAIASARATLDYTRVLSPLDGRTGIRQIDEGNIARASDANGLVVVTQLTPISVIFTLPQQQLGAVNKAMALGKVVAEALDGEGRAVLDRGTVAVVDNQVDQSTGTIKMKAEFENKNTQLWPGQFVNVRIVVDTLKQVVVVPTPAIQRGPLGPFVFAMTGEDTVTQRVVTVGMQTDTVSVITKGIAAGERVVTSGFTRLQDGSKVVVGRGAGGPPAEGVSAPAHGSQQTTDTPPAADGKRVRGEGKKREGAPAAGQGDGTGTGDGTGQGRRRRDGASQPTAETPSRPGPRADASPTTPETPSRQ